MERNIIFQISIFGFDGSFEVCRLQHVSLLQKSAEKQPQESSNIGNAWYHQMKYQPLVTHPPTNVTSCGSWEKTPKTSLSGLLRWVISVSNSVTTWSGPLDWKWWFSTVKSQPNPHLGWWVLRPPFSFLHMQGCARYSNYLPHPQQKKMEPWHPWDTKASKKHHRSQTLISLPMLILVLPMIVLAKLPIPPCNAHDTLIINYHVPFHAIVKRPPPWRHCDT